MSKNLCLKEIQTLFKLKTEMINVKNNFKSSHIENMWCRTCQLFSETQEHLYYCSTLRSHLIYVNFAEYSFNMIIGNIEQQEKFVKVYHVIFSDQYIMTGR